MQSPRTVPNLKKVLRVESGMAHHAMMIMAARACWAARAARQPVK